MNFEYNTKPKKINNIFDMDKKSQTFISFLECQVISFLHSKNRRNMITGEDYYKGNHDILKRQRTIIGKNGQNEIITNLPNNKIIDNQYSRLVDQKNSYLLSKPFTFYSENKNFLKRIKSIIKKKFFRTIKNIGEDAINCGIAWLYIFINQNGEIDFKRFKPFEILPFWEDDEHTILNMATRIYDVSNFTNNSFTTFTRVELYTKQGVYFYILKNNKLFLDNNNQFLPYITNYKGKYLSWDNIPLIPFKYNSKEIPLINKIKTLQDALNTIRSDFMNNLQEDARNTILVLKNYDGTNLAEFRKNLSEYGVVKVKTIDGNDGGVETLKINVDSSNYEIMAQALKRAIIENARGYDSKNEKIGTNPNKINIQSVYADIDLDASLMETEFQASFEQLIIFFKIFIKNYFKENYYKDNLDIIFNKDILINETEAIKNCLISKDIISMETIISQHPWVMDIDFELEKLIKQKNYLEKSENLQNKLQ